MNNYLLLLPISIGLGMLALVTFLWTLRKNQYDDLEGARYRILENDDFPLHNKQKFINTKPKQCDVEQSRANRESR